MTPIRGPQRRKEDMEREVGWWAMLLVAHRGKIVVVVGVLASAVTWALTTAGYRYTGPRDDIRHITYVIDTVRADVAGLKSINALRDMEVVRVKDQLEFLTYLSCSRVPVADAYAKEKCTRNRAATQ